MAKKSQKLDPSHELKGREERPQLEQAPPPLPKGVVEKDIVHPTRGKAEKLITDPDEYSGVGVA